MIALIAAPAEAGAAPSGTAKVTVAGLPKSVGAKVLVRGRGVRRQVRRTRTLRGLRPGRYVVIVRKVRFARRTAGIPAGSVALPVRKRARFRVRAKRAARVRVRYGTIRNAKARELVRAPVAVRGPATNPTAIVVKRSVGVRTGTFLTRRPSAQLPAGLFHRVTRVTREGKRGVLRLRPARLLEVFPQLEVAQRIQLRRVPGAVSSQRARAAAFEPLSAALDFGKFSCETEVTGASFGSDLSFSPSAVVDLSIPKGFRGFPTGLPRGQVSLTLAGRTTLSAKLQRSLKCEANQTLPALQGAIPTVPPIPVYAEVGAFGSLKTGAEVKAEAEAAISLTAGFKFKGTNFDRIAVSNSDGGASVSPGAKGELAVGPSVRFGVGVEKVGGDVFLDVKPQLAFSAGSEGCSLDLGGSVAGGVHLGVGKFDKEVTKSFEVPKANLYRCPDAQAPPGGGTPPPPQPTGSERARIAWDTDGSDIDLHVWDPDENHAWYQAQDGIPDGELSSDITSGFGPEIFTDFQSPSNRTLVYGLCYYADNGVGPTTVGLRITDPNGAVRNSSHTLSQTGDSVVVGASPAGAGFTPPPEFCGQ